MSAAPDLPAAVLWDMDGTLVDTEPYWMQAERELVEEHGGTWPDELAVQLVGQPLLVSADIIRRRSPVDLAPEEIVRRLESRVVAQIAESVPWRPGARELLAACREAGVRCALVTMSWTSLASAVVAATPEGSFALQVTGDRVARGKPDPEAYLTAASELGVAPGECVALEDSPAGVGAAVAAGVPTLAIPHVVPVPQVPGARQIATLEGLGVADLRGLAAATGSAG
ncbi:HAD family phosphatase [Janibacter alkaliphilus]|uniref:HAD superfamily hydrolase (TIGR01509 family) n=1 Tax=Janibacter alkaliphilus TaxID=1069963 RepID=A0A852XBN1_9MICO|nr:HAD superfamily hydrolase (TIGR01509 family) [Janibacter alkaliphilus]